MAFTKYLNLNKMKKSKHRGYAAIILLFSSIIIITPVIASTFKQLLKFSEISHILIQQKHERIAVLRAINESMDNLSAPGMTKDFHAVLINPSSSNELLVRNIHETIEGHAVSSRIYYMNYVISDDTIVTDALNFPPSKRPIAGERHFLIKTILHKNETPSFCKEIAVGITASGKINELWQREYVIF